MSLDSPLFEPVQFGSISLQNRIIMAPLTRGRAGITRVPNDMMAEYYAQRTSAGLIIAEATAVNSQGYGWHGAPAIYTDEQEAGWKKVTQAVHDKGGKIVLQLWHMGRVSHPDFHDGGALPVAPSAIMAEGLANTPEGRKPYVTPRAMNADELMITRDDYVRAAKRAINAGFDGVEIHMANGYLLDQFIRDGSNQREDEYGGSLENRLRFPLEVAKAIIDTIGGDKTSIRISPTNPFNSMNDSDPIKTFTTLAEALNPFGLAYLHTMEPVKDGPRFKCAEHRVTPHIREVFKGNLIANGSFDFELGTQALMDGDADAIAYGVPFLANPDLVERFKSGAGLNTPDQDTFYFGGAEGYTDYPFMKDKAA